MRAEAQRPGGLEVVGCVDVPLQPRPPAGQRDGATGRVPLRRPGPDAGAPGMGASARTIGICSVGGSTPPTRAPDGYSGI